MDRQALIPLDFLTTHQEQKSPRRGLSHSFKQTRTCHSSCLCLSRRTWPPITMVRFTDSNVVVDDYPPHQRDNQSRNGRWSPDYHYAGGAAPPSPGPIPDPARPVVTRENSLQIPHWDRYRPRSVPPPMSPTTEATSMVFPPPRSRSRNHDREDRESSYHGRDRDRHQDRTSRPKTVREAKGRHRDRYYDSGSSSSSDDERKGNKPTIARSRTPMSKARQAISSTFSDSTTGLATGVIGAVLGGLAAREASEKVLTNKGGHGHGHHHSGKEALLSTIAGAAVGALGANVIEKRIESSRKKTSSSAATSPTANGGKGSDDGRNYTWGGGGDERRRSSVVEERKDRSHHGGRRDSRDDNRETYRDRDIRRDRSQRRGSKEDRYNTSDDDDDDEVVYDYKRRSTRDRSRARRDDEERRDRR
ncbi:hypothetical protein QBC37DRAFT_433205 [Rhypophila decipiens]|uniref:Uncharacterized protein n=1 Tax=Rhypophila decipiens TaxID=261697 RepID=A0AAN6XXV9_9PEZI|nr:hypothetical protein QBC37DRAFT_433205 [Rhypophila decipiens]